MKCSVCGAESGKYPLCKVCNSKRETGEIIKCERCGKWHYKDSSCQAPDTTSSESYLYEPKKSLITESESAFYEAIKSSLPEGHLVFPQINLASFIDRTDNPRYRNELFRNVDFLITDDKYCPKIVIEINDQSHLDRDRRARDEKVANICEEAGIPIIKLWTSYGVNKEYIQNKINEKMTALPIPRVHHFNSQTDSIQSDEQEKAKKAQPAAKKGCYIATAVYGSYDCPEVWTLRRYRDNCLAVFAFGRLFIRIYYALSPTIVRIFGKQKWFNRICKKALDRFVTKLNRKGLDDSQYFD